MKSIKTLICAGLLALGVATSAKAAEGSLEVMCGDQTCAADLKVSGSVAPGLGIFARQTTGIDYKNQVSPFGLVDLTYNVVDGVDVVAEGQYSPGMGFMPRAGVQYFGQFGDFSVYALATTSLKEPMYGEVVANLRYQPALTERLDGVVNVEDVTDFSKKGHDFSAQKVRVGVALDKKVEAGAAVNMSETGTAFDGANYGGYLLFRF
ncbi:MAG: hypothetical protein WCV90_00695 [Candidatus Woesearchaeota archaeon]|jgi:hypothetical protein